MLILPLQCTTDQYDLFVFFADDSFARMRQYDPAEVCVERLGAKWQFMRLRHLKIGYANDDDVMRVQEFIKRGQPLEALEFLHRGFKVLPGDHDGPAMSLRPEPDEKVH